MKKILFLAIAVIFTLLLTLPVSAKVSNTEGDWLSRMKTQYKAANDGSDFPAYGTDLYNWLVEQSALENGALTNPTNGVHGVVASVPEGGSAAQTSWLYEVCTLTRSDLVITSQDQFETALAEMAEPANAIVCNTVNAFRLDYPEVNWLNGSVSMSYYGEYEDGTVTAYVYLLLKAEDYNICTSASPDTDAVLARAQAVIAASGADKLASAEEQIRALNTWLTKNNGYSSAGSYGSAHRDPMAALNGTSGPNGPVCEGYAKAFKICCDLLDIPCVLVMGEATNSSGSEAHMWNAVKMEDNNWYGVDVTWNDPVVQGKEEEAVSMMENENYLLVGKTKMASHTSLNYADTQKTIAFSDAPAFHESDYVPSNAAYFTTTDGKKHYYTNIDQAIIDFNNNAASDTLMVLRDAKTSQSITLSGSRKLKTEHGVMLEFTAENARIEIPAGANAEIDGDFKAAVTDYFVHVYGTVTYLNNEIYNDGGGVFKIYANGELIQTGGGINAKTVAVEISDPMAYYEFTGGGLNITESYQSKLYFNYTPTASTQPTVMMSNSEYFDSTPLVIDTLWSYPRVPIIRMGVDDFPAVQPARPGYVTFYKDSGKWFLHAGDEVCRHLGLSGNASVCTSCGKTLVAHLTNDGNNREYFSNINEALNAFQNSTKNRLTTLTKITVEQDIEMRNGKQLFAEGGELTFEKGASIIIPEGVSAEIKGHIKTNRPDYLVHVHGTLKYSNTEIYNDGGGVFILYENAVLNQTGGGINAKTVAVEISHPSARYEFNFGGLNVKEQYASRVFFNFRPSEDNVPQMYVNNSVYSRDMVIYIDVSWAGRTVPVIRYGDKNVPKVAVFDAEAVTLVHDAVNKIYSAGNKHCAHKSADESGKVCFDCGEELVAQYTTANGIHYYTDIDRAISDFCSDAASDTLTVLRDASTSKNITLSGSRKLKTEHGVMLEFTAENARIEIPAGANAEIDGNFRAGVNDYLVHVYGKVTYRNNEIYNDAGGVFKIYANGKLIQTGGGINAKTVAVEISDPTAYYEFNFGGLNVREQHASRVFFNFDAAADNQPQMYINNQLYYTSANNPMVLHITTSWNYPLVPVIRYDGEHEPKFAAADADRTVKLDSDSKEILAGGEVCDHSEGLPGWHKCPTCNEELAAYISYGDGVYDYFTDFDLALESFEESSDATLIIYKDVQINRTLTLNGKKEFSTKLNNNRMPEVTFTEGAEIIVSAGANAKLQALIKTNKPGAFIHVYGLLEHSNHEISNDGGGVFCIYENGTLWQYGGGITAKTYAIELKHPTAKVTYFDSTSADDQQGEVVFFNFTPDANVGANLNTYCDQTLTIMISWADKDIMVPVIRWFNNKPTINAYQNAFTTVSGEVVTGGITEKFIYAGNYPKIDVETSTNGNTATVETPEDTNTKISELIAAPVPKLEIDVTTPAQETTINTVQVPSDLIGAIHEAAKDRNINTESLKINMDTGSAELDDGVLKTIADAAGENKSVQLVLDNKGEKKDHLNEEQVKALEKEEVSAVIEVTLVVKGESEEDDTKISGFNGGTATMRIPFKIPAGQKSRHYQVNHVAEDGTLEKMKTRYEGGCLVWETGHFSDFVVIYDESNDTYTITGSITSYGDSNAEITIRLLDKNGIVVEEVTTKDTTYTMTFSAEPGDYTLEVRKDKHVPRRYAVTLRGEN